MKHAKTTPNGVGLIHGVYRVTGAVRGPRWASLCGMTPTAPDAGPARWGWTEDRVTCSRCLAKLEQLAEQAIADTAAIWAVAELASWHRAGANRRYADPARVRAFRRAWPAMGKAVATLLRGRGFPLGEGWTGPAREAE